MLKEVSGWTTCAVAVLLAACSRHSTKPMAAVDHRGAASYHVIADDQMDHYPLAMGSTSSGAELLAHPVPSYPSSMLASCPAEIQLQALLIVGKDGKIKEVRADDAPATARAFVAAVRAAVINWRFEPMVISHWAANADAEAHPVDAETKPFSLPYAFYFACHGGKAQVSSAAAAPERHLSVP